MNILGVSMLPCVDQPSPSPSFTDSRSTPPGRVAAASRARTVGQVRAGDVEQARVGPHAVVGPGVVRVEEVVGEGVEHVGPVAGGAEQVDETRGHVRATHHHPALLQGGRVTPTAAADLEHACADVQLGGEARPVRPAPAGAIAAEATA